MAENSNRAVIPPPPRATGDAATDTAAMIEWAWALYKGGVLESGLLDPSFQLAEPPAFDPANLPDPANTTISKAQQTANEAYLLAQSLVP